MHKPLIGVLPLYDEFKESYWMLPGYMKMIEQAGGIPLMLPLTDDIDTLKQLATGMDGFLFTGGHDVSPSVYHEAEKETCAATCPERDAMENVLFHEAYLLDKPMFGICRGIQFFNAILGGTLYQDLPSEHPSPIEHHQSPPYDTYSHEVIIDPKSPLYDVLNKDTLLVNSYHHQAIKDLANDLQAMAKAEDGIIEAVYNPQKHFVWAVQWHPEFNYTMDEDSRKIIKKFIEEAKR